MARASFTPASTSELRELLHRWQGRPTAAYRFAHELSAVSDKGTPDLVSVVVTAFGQVNTQVLRTALKSIALQRGVRVEPILVEQVLDAGPALEPIAREYGARHVVDAVPTGSTSGRFVLARARNAGIAASTGRFLYFTDADVVLADPTYLARLVELARLHDDLVLCTPRNKHLLHERLPEACDHFLAHGSWDTGGIERIGNHALRWIGADHAGASSPAPEIVETALGGVPCIARKPDLDAYHADPASWRGREPQIWNLIVHHGSVMVRRRHLDMVAGYAECYIGWGLEDNDLQWKLAELFLVASLARLPDVAVVHLEHPRSWFDPLLWQRNQLIFEERRRKGVLDTVFSDLLTGTTPYADHLRATLRWNAGAEPGVHRPSSSAPY